MMCRDGWTNIEESMIPHICASLQGYPDRWVLSLKDGGNLTIPKLLACMNHVFGDVHGYDTMIRSLYKIRQKDMSLWRSICCESMGLSAEIHCAYLDQISDQGKNLM